MSRSYFSNITRATHTPGLLPLRPISALWKAARLEAAAKPDELAVSHQPSRFALSVPAARTERTSMLSMALGKLPVPSSPALDFARPVRQKRSQAKKETTVPALSTVAAQKPLALDTRIARPRPVHKTQIAPLLAPSAKSEPETQIEGEAGRRSAHRRARWSAVAAEQKEELERRAEQVMEHRATATRLESTPESPARPATSNLETRNQIVTAQPIALSPEQQVDQARPAAAAVNVEQALPQKTQNSVHIGRVEVQIVPPAPRRTQPPSPKATLARGYTLWPRYSQI